MKIHGVAGSMNKGRTTDDIYLYFCKAFAIDPLYSYL